MFGVLLAAISSACHEISDTIGKRQISAGSASLYTFGFLNYFFATLILIAVGFLFNDFAFSLHSLPTFLPRIGFEILQAHLSIMALVRADRSDYSFIRTLTIPLLLMADIALGYTFGVWQFAGIVLIFAAIAFLLYAEGYKTNGGWILLACTVNAAITISLFKYDITHFNSVPAEQSIILLILMLYFFVMAARLGENPVTFLIKRPFALQATASGFAASISSFAYLFAPAAVITTSVRASAVLFALISGKLYFHESRFVPKLLVATMIIAGLIMLA